MGKFFKWEKIGDFGEWNVIFQFFTFQLLHFIISCRATHAAYPPIFYLRFQLVQISIFTNRLVPIMLLKLPIMLWSNAPEICLLCSNYAPYINYYTPQILHFLSLIYTT